jgi:hypothetical protein
MAFFTLLSAALKQFLAESHAAAKKIIEHLAESHAAGQKIIEHA